jgi:DnaJ domain
MTTLFAPGYSVTRTKRRRLLWAAWWSGPPVREPFRKPDAAQGGARTLDEARAEAERAAERPLAVLDPSWARAWARVLQGEPPWPTTEPKAKAVPRAGARPSPEVSVWAILGLTSRASAEEVKSAYRRRALELHPDRGGQAAAFRALHAAYEEALRRLAKKPRKR